MVPSNIFTVLIVDDTMTNLLVLGKTLENSGYKVLKASSGPVARELAQQHKPELILLDIMMPDEDGYQTIAKLKADSITNAIPVIFLTAITDVESKIKGFELGAVDFITKPFHPAEVRIRVKLHIKLSIATNALINEQREKLNQIETAQLSLLTQPDDLPSAKFATYYLALEEAGGDFYDVFPISNSSYGYFVGDVAGHDIATSFITASVKALLKQNCQQIYEPCESMKMINEVLLDVLPSGKYLTATYIKLDRKNHIAQLVCMGHPPVIYHAIGKDPVIIKGEGDVLGIFSEVLYTEASIKVSDGDRFYMYSDGLIEIDSVWSANVDALRDEITRLGLLPLDEVVQTLSTSMLGEGQQPDDDVVILAVEV